MPRLSMSRYAARATVLLLASTAACSPHPRGVAATVPPPQPVSAGEFVLRVINHHWLDIDVYVLHDGQRTHVGIVTATTTQEFLLTARLLGGSGQIALYADAVGSPETVRSETIVLQPGQYIEWILESSLRRSSLGVY
jgi:hypothetical protein